MDEELRRKIAASLDQPDDAMADPDVVRALERDPEAHAFARGLYVIERALRRWPAPQRTAAEWERLEGAVLARTDEALAGAAKVRKGAAVPRDEFDALAAPRFDDDPSPHMMETKQAMSEPQENDADLENLAALTRTSTGPALVPSAAPRAGRTAITEDADEMSSGIVDIKHLAEMARKQSAAPPAPEAPAEAPKADAKPRLESVPRTVEMKKTDDVMVKTAASSASVAPTMGPLDAPARRRNTGPLWMLGGVAIAAAAFFALQSSRGTPDATTGSTSLGNEEAPPSAAAPAPSPATTPTPAAEFAAPAEVPAQVPAQVVAPPAEPSPAPATPAFGAGADQGATAQPAPAPTAAAPQRAAGPRDERENASDTERARAVRRAPTTTTARERQPARPEAPTAPQPVARPAPPPAPAPTTATATPTPAAGRAQSPRGAAAAAAEGATGGARPGSVDDLMAGAVRQNARPTGLPAAPAPAAQPAAPAADLPERPTRSMITSVLGPLNSQVRSCAQGQTGTVPVRITIGNDGAVRDASASGPFQQSVLTCIEGVVRRARFRAFRTEQANVTFPFVILPPRPGQE